MIVLTTLRVNAKPEPSDSAKGMAGVVADVREGLAFVWRQKLVLAAISLDLFAVLLGGATYLLPVFAKDILGVDERGLGLLASAPAAGAVVTAMILAYLPPMKRAGLTLLLAVAGFGMATIVFGLSTNFWLSLAMLFLTGVFDNVSVVVRHTLVQLATPDAMRGRVSAVSSMFISSSNELGGVESGLVAAWTTPVFSVVSGGVGTLVIVLAWAGLFPDLRRLQRLDQVG
jgi:MFS family permease